MHCGICGTDVGQCTCPDIDERLKSLTLVLMKWCLECDKHYARCKCAEPVFGVRTDGKNMPTTFDFTKGVP